MQAIYKNFAFTGFKQGQKSKAEIKNGGNKTTELRTSTQQSVAITLATYSFKAVRRGEAIHHRLIV